MSAMVLFIAFLPAVAQKSIEPPLVQLREGIPLDQIQCKEGLQLVTKASDLSPACVRPSTAERLIEVMWALPNDSDQNKTITLDDNGKSITLHVGQDFLLKLGETYNWDVQIDNQTVVSRVMNIMVVRGAQGIYDAHVPGNATLSAAGDPQCRSATPACAMPSILFQLHIRVVP